MNCGDARRLFGAYWDDEVTLAEREWLEAHFTACAGCRTEYEAWARAIELAGSLPRVEVVPGLAERTLARARRVTAVPDRLPVRPARWIPITATAALVTIAATMLMQWMGVAPVARLTPSRPATAVTEPVLVSAPGAAGPAADRPSDRDAVRDAGWAAGVPDSLFDHSADVEFILDPVTLRKGRAHTVLHLNPNVRGDKAVITF
jgi:hypothetical protein